MLVTATAAQAAEQGEASMKFTLTIDCDNAAFGDPESDYWGEELMSELQRVVRSAANKLEGWVAIDDATAVLDSNGNKVGEWVLSA